MLSSGSHDDLGNRGTSSVQNVVKALLQEIRGLRDSSVDNSEVVLKVSR